MSLTGGRRLSARRVAAAALATGLLRACVSVPDGPIPTPQPAPSVPAGRPMLPPPPQAPFAAPPAPARIVLDFDQVAGWDSEDHAAALRMFRAGCGAARDPVWRAACVRARALAPVDQLTARAFWERNFRLEPVGAAGPQTGLLTGYFAPEYPARKVRRWPYVAPLRAPPADLPAADVGIQPISAPYADRTTIERTPAIHPLAWMKPEDLFFLQIQGSGVIDLPDGRRLRAVYAANNGLPFVGIAAPMKAQGLLSDTSGDAIHAWLAAHRGPLAQTVMRLNPRYIFYSLQPYDGREPVGAAGATLTPGRSLAVDPSRHDFGAVYWIDGEAPALPGAFPAYRRLAMALDAGYAIKGDVRADLYLGTGRAAGVEAGRVKHRLRLYRLVPVADPALVAAGR